MATPTKHSLISPSNLHRVLNCTAAPRFEEQFPAQSSVYSREGTLAHKACEVAAQYVFGDITKRKKNAELKKFQNEELWDEEMIKTSEFYAQYLWEKSMTFKNKPYAVQEVKVDLSDYIPDGFGTCDHVMIGDDTLCITDYKHGKGVEVSAENNPQMRMYALGALKKYQMIFGNVKYISMAIVQPRITEKVSEDRLTVEELLAWGEQIKPLIEKAYTGNGEFHSGSWCKFCRGREVCRARAENFTALEDFKDLPIEGKMSDAEKILTTSPILTDAEIGDLLIRGKELANWLNDLQDYALGAIMAGKSIPGWKVVEGRSTREFTNPADAINAIKNLGLYAEDQLYETKALSLAKLEKLMGKKLFADTVGNMVVYPPGKPTLATQADKREPYNPAAADFAGAV